MTFICHAQFHPWREGEAMHRYDRLASWEAVVAWVKRMSGALRIEIEESS